MAAPDPIRVLRPQGQVSVVLGPDDARTLVNLAFEALAFPLASDPERMALLSLACQLRQALRQ